MFYREWLPSCSTRHFIRTTLHRCHAAAPASVHIEGNSTDFIAALNNTLNTVQKGPEVLTPIPTDNTMSFKKTMQLFSAGGLSVFWLFHSLPVSGWYLFSVYCSHYTWTSWYDTPASWSHCAGRGKRHTYTDRELQPGLSWLLQNKALVFNYNAWTARGDGIVYRLLHWRNESQA